MKFSFALILAVLCLAIAYGQDDTTSEPQAETTPQQQAETTPQQQAETTPEPQAETTPQQAETTSQEPAEATTEAPTAQCRREFESCRKGLGFFRFPSDCARAINHCTPIYVEKIMEMMRKLGKK